MDLYIQVRVSLSFRTPVSRIGSAVTRGKVLHFKQSTPVEGAYRPGTYYRGGGAAAMLQSR